MMPLLFPHQQKYAFLLAGPALFYLAYVLVLNFRAEARHLGKSRWIAIVILSILSFALMTLTTDSLVGRSLNLITQHYKLITWGALVLILILVIAPPGKAISGERY